LNLENIQYNLNFDKLCETACIGKRCGEPAQIMGGLLHRMYCVETTMGKYAVKTLNPQIMLRPKAMSDIVNGERIAEFAMCYIPVSGAKRFGGEAVLEIGGQYYMVFDWIEGSSIYNESITPWHCEQMGVILGKLHTIDFSSLNLPKPAAFAEEAADWDDYLAKGEKAGLSWVDELLLHKDELGKWNQRYITAMKYLENRLVVGHRDIDPKNVLWCDGKPVVIDWESAGYINPSQEFIVHALYWAETTGSINKEKFMSFAKGYTCNTSFDKVDWRIVMDAGLCPDWLVYSLKRSLGIESADDAERQLGTEQVFGTIRYLKRYEESIAQIVEWMGSMRF